MTMPREAAAPRYDVRRDRILFVDVEMTCWDGSPPTGHRPEVIEIGLAEVDVVGLEITRSASILVRPMRSTVSPFCERLTGLSDESLRRSGRPLREAAATLRREWGTAGKGWMAWGADRRAIDDDCALAGISSPFSASFHDIGRHFGFLLGFDKRGVGLSEAVRMTGVEQTGRKHSGEGDALTTASVWMAFARLARSEFVLEDEDRPEPHGSRS